MPPDARNMNISTAAEHSLGRANFIARSDRDSSERREGLAQIIAEIEEEKLEVVRARPIEARLFPRAARNGVAFTTGLFAMDSANSIFQNVFAADGGFSRDEMGGAGDMLAVPDLATFRVLPWAHKSGWVVARANIGLFPNLPFFQGLLRASGFAAEADRAEQGEAEAALSDGVLDAICLLGPLTRCREQLAEYRDAGVDLPILWPAVDVDSVRAAIRAFRQ